MNEETSRLSLDALQSQRGRIAPGIPPKLVESIFRIEERVQFDGDRKQAASRIREIVQTFVEQTAVGAGPDEH